MKRKLSLLLAMVLAMTMVMGIGVTAFADYNYPSSVECDLHSETEHSNLIHYYVIGLNPADEDLMIAAVYMNGVKAFDNDEFDSLYYYDGPGWYYLEPSTDEYIKCPSAGPTPPDDPTPSGSLAPAHVHNFQWQTITEPTKDADGLEGEVCSCGATRNTQKLSAYGYALNQYATPMINAAKSGQTITFEFGEWNSFPKSFMAKLVDKSAQNVTFVFKYKWNHKLQTITIPAGTPIDLNFDWYGPAKMVELYGAN